MKLNIDLNKCSLCELKVLIGIKERQYDESKEDPGRTEFPGITKSQTDEVVFGESKNRRKYNLTGKYSKKRFRANKPWTVNEYETVIRELRNGNSRSKIAKLLNRTTNSIYNVISDINNKTAKTKILQALKNVGGTIEEGRETK